MKNRSLLVLLLTAFAFAAVSSQAQAVILIYRVTSVSRALFYPKAIPIGNSVTVVGYLIFDSQNSGASESVEVFARTRTYNVNGRMLNILTPGSFSLTTIDRTGDQNPDTVSALIGFTTQNGVTDARAIIGTLPRSPLHYGTTFYPNVAPVLRGNGSRIIGGSDQFNRTETFTIDVLTGQNFATAADGRAAVVNRLGINYHAQ